MRPPTATILVSIFFDGGIDSMSVLAPTGHSQYAGLRPTLALGPSEGTASARTRACAGTPPRRPLATLHGEGKVSTFPAIGYTSPNQSHFTSRHFYEIGELEIGARTGWLGRYIDRTGTDDNPLQGLSLDGSALPLARHLLHARRRRRRRHRLRHVDTHGVGDPVDAADVRQPSAASGLLLGLART